MKTTETIDVLTNDVPPVTGRRPGKNYDDLVNTGSWVISGFEIKRTRCTCCGRPIVRALRLRNDTFAARPASNRFAEEIDVGLTCGPKVFAQSCTNFYEDPTREWERQWKIWKDYVFFLVIVSTGRDAWDALDAETRDAIDSFIDGATDDVLEHSGPWWIVRDAKKRFISSVKRASREGVINVRAVSRARERLVKHLSSSNVISLRSVA